MAKKPNTDDILSKIRKQKAGNSGGEADASPSEEAAAPAEKPKAAPTGGPADIMAKIRAQGSGGEAAKAADDSPAPKKAAPKSPADIMAAIRSQGTGGAAAKSESAAPTKKAAVAATPAGDLPPVDEMLRQMKTGKVGGATVAAAAAPAKPVLKVPVRPKKTAAAAVASTRRGFLSWFAAAWVLLTVTSGAWALGLARFMFPNVLVEPPSQFKIGSPADYPLGTVSTKYTASNAIWVVRTDQYKGKDLIYALASVCTHLGCTPSWLEGEQKFKCPCHGSGFYMTGINFEGPAPRPLERVGLAVAPDGMLEVDKSVKFQEEKGQWEDAKSFVDASLV
ncbi:MAG: Rieske 2Fe-2S domain-containing protein [Planctomycetales bacterium]